MKTELELKNSTFNKIRKIVYDRSGISLGENKQALVRARIFKQMRRCNVSTYDEYVNLVENDETGYELEYMLEAISTNTTEFYREKDHFEILRNILGEWVTNGRRRLRIWCTAASTGEEPYTLAIETLESVGSKYMNIKILATDISRSVLETAMAGVYSDEKTAPIPILLKNKYFSQTNYNGEVTFRARPVIKNLLLFRRMNLSVTPYRLNKQLDIVFCRNVMFYFDKSLQQRMIDEFRRLIKPGGYLFVGHAEPIAAFSTGFESIKPSVYIRK